MLNPVVNRDTKLLNNLQKVLNILIQDCIRMTDWKNPEEIAKNKDILQERMLRCTQQFFEKIQGDSYNSYLGVKQEASSQASVAVATTVGVLNQQQYQQPQQQQQLSGSQSAQSTQSYDQKINDINVFAQQEKQKFVVGEDYGLFGEVENQSTTLQSFQRAYNHNEPINRLNRQKNNKRKHVSRDSQSDDYNPDSDNSEEDFPQVQQRRRRGRRPNNPDSKYQNSDGRREIYPEPGQPRSIGNYPASEKKRVIDFFNAHYDPLKRNKIDLVQQIVQSLNYSYASVYYLVSNQNLFQEQYAQSQANPNVSSYQGQPQAQSLNASMISNNASRGSRYLNKGCYGKPGRPKKYQQESPGRPNYKENNNNYLQSDEQLFHQDNSMPASSGPRPRGRPPKAKQQDQSMYQSEGAYYDYNDGNEYDKNEDAPAQYSDEYNN